MVLDASALLALLHGEAGTDVVEQVLPTAIISSVNWSEVAQKMLQHNRPVAAFRADLVELGLEIVPFEIEDAETAAEMYERTSSSGLSLGDRACLSLAWRFGVPALTGDRRWVDISTGVEVRLIG
ncbi:MAG: PIN domain-containing protein [Chloroflexota bacterium]|nr:MAG: PIN domain-containing protein [Chloroflexota bacterium]